MKILKDIKEGIGTSQVHMKEFSILSWKPNTITVKTSILGLQGKSVEKHKTDITGQFRPPPPSLRANEFLCSKGCGASYVCSYFPRCVGHLGSKVMRFNYSPGPLLSLSEEQ